VQEGGVKSDWEVEGRWEMTQSLLPRPREGGRRTSSQNEKETGDVVRQKE